MASKVIRRSKSDPNHLLRKKFTLVDGKLFSKKGNVELEDEVQLVEKGGEFEGRFKKKNSSEGVKKGLRVTKAYLVTDNRETEPPSAKREERLKSHRVKDLDRRHTVGGALTTVPEIPEEAEIDSEKDWKKDVLINYLTDRYQEYYQSADNVTMDHSDTQQSYTNGYTETDLDDTVSEFDTAATGGFRRGGRARASLPVVRHAMNKSKEKPLGLVYLQYMNETKRALMPNEITGMDTVRALFVRSFKGKLSMEMMELPERKIYIRDPLTEIFYELENPQEVRDRTVLKIYEPGFQESTDGSMLRSAASTPVDLSYHSEPEVDQQVRQRRYHTMTMPVVNEREVDVRQRTKSEGATFSKQGPPTQKQGNTSSGQQHHMDRRQQPQYFQRGVPERATVGGTTPQRVPQNQAPFQRGVPGRASATLPRGGEASRGVNVDRRIGPPQQTSQGTQERRDKQTAPVANGRMNVAPGNRPILSGSKTLPPGASLEKPRSSHQPHPDNQRTSSQKMTDQRRLHGTVMRRGPEGDSQHLKTAQGSRNQPSSYSTSPRRGPPQNGSQTIQGHRSQPDLRVVQNSTSAIQHGRGSSNEEDTTRRIASMEAQIANLAGMVRSALHHGGTQSQGGSPVRTKPQMNGNVQSQPINGPGPVRQYPVQKHPDGSSPTRQQHRPGIANGPSQGGRPQAGVKPIQGMKEYHSAQNSPRQTHQQRLAIPPQQSHRDGDLKETTPKLNLIPAQVEFIPPTGEPTTPNIGYVKTSDDSKTNKTAAAPPQRRPNGVVSASQTNLKRSIRELREEHRNVRKMHLHMVQQMNDSFRSSGFKIRQALDSKPGVQDHPIRGQRSNVAMEMAKYKQKRELIDRDLKQLESQVEKLRLETVSKRSQVDIKSVDNLAQLLGNNSRLIAEQKAIFPVLSDKMKAVMEGEMEVVVVEERFLRDEPGILDEYFKRCKKLTGTLYTLKRLAEVQDLQGSKSDLSSDSEIKITTQQLTQHVPNKSQLTPNQSQTTPINPQPSQPQTQPQTQTSTQHQLRSRFASPAQKSRFEQSLREGKKNLRTTLFSQNASHRQKRHTMALYNQEHHDRLTPMVTPEKEARKAASKKKGPPPPPPPRRSSSTVKASPVSPNVTSQSNQEAVVERKEVLVTEKGLSGCGSAPDISKTNEETPQEGSSPVCLSHSSGDLLPPQHSVPESSSSLFSQSVMSKSCDDRLHEFHSGLVNSDSHGEGAHGEHAKNLKNLRMFHQHGFRAIQSGVSEPDIISSNNQKGPPKPPRGNLLDQRKYQMVINPKSAFQVVTPRPRTIPPHASIRTTLSSSFAPLPSTKIYTVSKHTHLGQSQHGTLDAHKGSNNEPQTNKTAKTVADPQSRTDIIPDTNLEISQSRRQQPTAKPPNSEDGRTKQLKEQYAKLRALQNQKKDQVKEDAPRNSVAKPNEGTPSVVGPNQEVPTKEVLIEGKKNLQNTEHRQGDSIDKVLEDLENFAMKAGNITEIEGESYKLDTPIIVESRTALPPSGSFRSPDSAEILQSQPSPKTQPLSSRGTALVTATGNRNTNNNLEGTASLLPKEVSASMSPTKLKPDIGKRESANERLRDIHTSSKTIILQQTSSSSNNNSQSLLGKDRNVEVLDQKDKQLGPRSEVQQIYSQQITIKSPRGQIEETFIF